MIEFQLNSYNDKWVMSNVRRAVDSITHQITDTSKVERRVLIKVGRYLSLQDSNKNNKKHILRLIFREVNDSLKRNRREYAEHLADLTTQDEEGQDIEYEPEDVLANVGSAGLEIKETITLLAKDDRRRKTILNEWMNGNTNDMDISRILADSLGGQARSHRIFIQRFRIECQEQLSEAI